MEKVYFVFKNADLQGDRIYLNISSKSKFVDVFGVDGWDRVVRFYPEDEYNAVHQELLQCREEMAKLMQRADQLLNENIQLQQELEEVRYAKKVQLPRDVAEALEKAKKWTNGDLELIAWCVPDLNWTKSQESYWSTLRRFGDEKSFFELIDALRYGYVIESPGDRIQQRLIEVFEKKGGYSKGTAVELADHIVPIILEELNKMEREKATE